MSEDGEIRLLKNYDSAFNDEIEMLKAESLMSIDSIKRLLDSFDSLLKKEFVDNLFIFHGCLEVAAQYLTTARNEFIEKDICSDFESTTNFRWVV